MLIAMRGIASNQNKLSYYYGGREETARALAILIPPLALFTLWKQRRAASVCQETEASGGLFSLLSSEVALWLRSPGEQQLCPGGQICFSDRPWPPRYCLMCVIRNGASAREDCFLPQFVPFFTSSLRFCRPEGSVFH